MTSATTLAMTSADFTLEEKPMKEKWTDIATAIFRTPDHPEIDETTESLGKSNAIHVPSIHDVKSHSLHHSAITTLHTNSRCQSIKRNPG